MTLTLRAVSLNDQPLTQPITAHFDAKGGTIGRSDHNTMALPDPERHISRQQAQISSSSGEGGYLIKNVGSANPIIVRGQPLPQGETTPLSHGDQVRIGGYLLEVIEECDQDSEASTITRGRAVVDAHTPPLQRAATPVHGSGSTPRPPATPAGPFADLGAPLSSSNPFADLLGAPAPLNAPPLAPAPPAALPPSPSPLTAPLPVAAAQAAAAQQQAARSVPPPTQDPFADLGFGAPAGIPPDSAAWAPPPQREAAPRLPDDFDPFAAPPVSAPPVLPPTAPSPAGAGAFDDLIPSAAPTSIDEMFGLGGAASPQHHDPLADFMAGTPPQGKRGEASHNEIGGAVLPTDPLALFGGLQTPSGQAGTPAAADHTPELRGAFRPPGFAPARSAPLPEPPGASPLLPTGVDWLGAATPVPEQPPASPPASEAPPVAKPAPPQVQAPLAPQQVPSPQPAPAFVARDEPPPAVAPTQAAVPQQPASAHAAAPAGMWSGDTRELWRAFCEGAGLRLEPPQGLNPELMRVMGTLLRTSVEGTLQMMAVRAATKHELRAQVTIIQARNNNPLKFSPDAQSALEQMLQPPVRGFMSGPAAMNDAMNDLVGHTIGTMAGTRAALEGVLGRFRPTELEAKLVGKSVLDSLLPMNRKAKLWELYLTHFEAIREEAQEDFHTLFGKAFLAAYEQQLERLQREKSSRAAPSA